MRGWQRQALVIQVTFFEGAVLFRGFSHDHMFSGYVPEVLCLRVQRHHGDFSILKAKSQGLCQRSKVLWHQALADLTSRCLALSLASCRLSPRKSPLARVALQTFELFRYVRSKPRLASSVHSPDARDMEPWRGGGARLTFLEAWLAQAVPCPAEKAAATSGLMWQVVYVSGAVCWLFACLWANCFDCMLGRGMPYFALAINVKGISVTVTML